MGGFAPLLLSRNLPRSVDRDDPRLQIDLGPGERNEKRRSRSCGLDLQKIAGPEVDHPLTTVPSSFAPLLA